VATCEWNPAEKRPAFDDDPPHGEATQVVGVDGKWHLCDGCASLPEFARYRKRSTLKRRVPPRVKRRANRQAQATSGSGDEAHADTPLQLLNDQSEKGNGNAVMAPPASEGDPTS
jgi:hypothetical protein